MSFFLQKDPEALAAMSSEERRLAERSIIMYNIRRLLRFVAIGITIIVTLKYLIGSGELGASLSLGVIVGVLFYVFTWVITAIAGGYTLKAYFYLRDLFGGDAQTRL